MVRAPLRISFVGGGTDLPDFYTRCTGRVISASINKYVYVLVNPTPLLDKFTVKYQRTEMVNHPRELEHTRIRAALLDMGLTDDPLEIGTFGDLPARSGLGSSSSFTVALVKALHAHLGKMPRAGQIAEAAARLEIELLGEPIGKQDQYAAAFGGFNVFEFRPDHTVSAEPVPISTMIQQRLEDSLVLFYTGINRDAGTVLYEQRKNIEGTFPTLRDMAESVLEFRDRLLAEDFAGLGRMLHEGWERKKSLATAISSGPLDKLYEAGQQAGAWGGKVLGAGGGGCLFFLVPPPLKDGVRAALTATSKLLNLQGFKALPLRFTKPGSEVLLHQESEASA
jgi:D-glycero-alpha-D-manno-heptose-7-phosphate kinase